MADLSLYQIIQIFHGKSFEEAVNLLESLIEEPYGSIKKDEDGLVHVSLGGWSNNEILMNGFQLTLNKYIVGTIRGVWILHPGAEKFRWKVLKE